MKIIKGSKENARKDYSGSPKKVAPMFSGGENPGVILQSLTQSIKVLRDRAKSDQNRN